jgi:YkoY family integral membrane protein
VGIEWTDIGAILVLVLLEGLLSADNALVLAVIVMQLPEDQQRKALRYGLIGAFVLRSIATTTAYWLIQVKWISLVGGLYLLWLPYKHFTHRPEEHSESSVKPAAVAATGFLGLPLFWSVVAKVELVDLVFAVDSILAALGVSRKLWVIITGGLLGIVMMRILAMQVLTLVKRYPKLIDGAYVIVAWIGVKLVVEYLHGLHVDTTLLGRHIAFEGHRWFPHIGHDVGIGVVAVLFLLSFLYARHHAAPTVEHAADDAMVLLTPRGAENGAGAPAVEQEGGREPASVLHAGQGDALDERPLREEEKHQDR